MRFRLPLTIAVAITASHSAIAARLSREDIDSIMQAPIGGIVEIDQAPAGRSKFSRLRLERFDVYAPDARTVLMTPEGEKEVPRSKARHFRTIRGDGDAIRMSLSFEPDSGTVSGVLIADGEGTFSVTGSRGSSGAIEFEIAKSDDAGGGEPAIWQCGGQGDGGLKPSSNLDLPNAVFDASMPLVQADPLLVSPIAKETLAASRTATVMIETDNEFLAQKFGGNQTDAETYLTNLFAAMNVIYERDLDVTMQKGFTRLWSAGTPDPYTQQPTAASQNNQCGSIRGEQLDEFGNYWQANEGARTPRAFVAMLSGKMPNEFCSAGIAWLTGQSGGATNMCQQTSGNGGHYSYTMVFKFAEQTAANDLGVVAHEIGHNFGASHTHCTDTSATAGLQPIDRCYNGEAAFGCYSGTPTCPSPQTINGESNVTGTLMSYCHITPAGCDSFNVFHPVHEAQLRTIATNNVTSGCFTTGAAPGSFTIANASITEGNSGTQTLNFVVTRTGGSGSASVTATTSAGSAAAAEDYVHKSQTLTFASATTQNFSVTINGDTRDENDETFTVTLSNPTNGFTLGSPSSATGTITDNDNPPTVSINSPSAATEGAPITFTVSLSAASGKAISVNHTTASGGGATGAIEGSDFSDATGTLNFAVGETSKTFDVTTSNDTLDEADTETFTATLSAATNATLGTSSGTGSISDNDQPPTISISDVSIAENNAMTTRFVVTLSSASGRAVSVTASTADNTAVAPGDYQARSGVTVNFAAGDTSENFDVTRVGDTTFEPDESFFVNLTNPVNATIADGTGVGTILNDDAMPGVVSIADASLVEASADMIFTVSIPIAVAQATSVTYSVAPIDATQVLDYVAVTGTATITAGNTSTTINVPIVGDVLDEWDEQFAVNIAATSSSTIGDGQAVGTIIDNDAGGDPLFRNGFE